MKYDNTNTGVLFRAGEKRNDKSPDYIGSLNVEGKEWTIFGRMKTSKAGKPFMSLSLVVPKPKEEAAPDFDDPIPF
jgi:hypothetical protein